MLKSIIQRILRLGGRELCSYSENERNEASRLGWDRESLNYKEFQVARTLAAGGHITLNEARFLASLVNQTDSSDPIIEIGTLFGFSTLVLAMNKAQSQKLLTVDKYVWNPLGISPLAHELATRAVLEDACTHHNVEIIRQDKDVFYENYQGQRPGLFFCDANHDYQPTLDDLTWARSVGAKIICGHDYDPDKFPGVVRAVKELGGASKIVGSIFVL